MFSAHQDQIREASSSRWLSRVPHRAYNSPLPSRLIRTGMRPPALDALRQNTPHSGWSVLICGRGLPSFLAAIAARYHVHWSAISLPQKKVASTLEPREAARALPRNEHPGHLPQPRCQGVTAAVSNPPKTRRPLYSAWPSKRTRRRKLLGGARKCGQSLADRL